MIESFPSEVLDRPVAGWNLRGDSLRAELGDTPALLLFLRHFG